MSYSINFYNNQKKGSLFSARELISLPIINVINPSSVIDFGCGTGSWLSEFKKQGTEVVLGIDGEFALPSFILNKKYFKSVNFESSYNIKESFDLAICLEVLEHLSESAGNYLIDTMTECSDVLLISAAVPYQGGTGHINENWLEYWTLKFNAKGYECFDILRPLIWNNNNIDWWYRQNLVLYIKKNHPLNSKLSEFASFQGVSVIHPLNFINAIHKNVPDAKFKRSIEKDKNYYRNLIKSNTVVRGLSYGKEYEFDPSEKNQSKSKNLKNEEDIDTNSLFYLMLLKEYNPQLKNNLSKNAPSPQDIIRLKKNNKPQLLIICDNLYLTEQIHSQLRNNKKIWTPPVWGIDFFMKEQNPKWYQSRASDLRNKALNLIEKHLKNNDHSNVSSKWIQLLTHISAVQDNIEWYSEIFSFGSDTQLKVEISHLYSFLSEENIIKLRGYNQNLKVLFIKERCFSKSKGIKLLMYDLGNDAEEAMISSTELNKILESKNTTEQWRKIFQQDFIEIILDEETRELTLDIQQLFTKKSVNFNTDFQLNLNFNL